MWRCGSKQNLTETDQPPSEAASTRPEEGVEAQGGLIGTAPSSTDLTLEDLLQIEALGAIREIRCILGNEVFQQEQQQFRHAKALQEAEVFMEKRHECAVETGRVTAVGGEEKAS